MRNTQNAKKSLIFLGSPAPVTDKNPIFQTHEPPNSFRTQELINKKVLYQKFSKTQKDTKVLIKNKATNNLLQNNL